VNSENTKRLIRLSNCHCQMLGGQTIHLIGNGPNLDLTTLKKLTGKIFTCNGFALSNEASEIAPMLYFLGDPICGTEGFLARKRLLENIIVKCPYAHIFTSEEIARSIFSYWHRSELATKIGPPRILYSPYTGGGPPRSSYRLDLGNGLEDYQNVLVLMIKVALFMGAAEICLHGFDFSSILRYPHRQGKQHFYENEKTPQWHCSTLNHTDNGHRQIEFFRSSYLTLVQLSNLRVLSERKGVKITNYNKNSLLEVFEKRNAFNSTDTSTMYNG